MADENGWVRVGIDEPDYHNQCWFTDGYFDYVPHFLEGMALLPQTAPASEDHLLKSSSIIQKISYNPLHIKYRTFDSSAEELISLTFTPTSIICCGEQLIQVADPSAAVGWSYDPGQRLLRVSHTASEVELMGN